MRFGVWYELHKREALNRIYSYDSNHVKKEEKDDYLRMFEESGWHLVGKWSNDTRFFWAEEGTPPVHSDALVLGDQYRSIFWGSLACVVLACVLALLGGSNVWLYALGGAMLSGGALLMVACYFRMKGKRFTINPRSYGYQCIRLLTGGVLWYMILTSDREWNLWRMFPMIVATYFIAVACIDLIRIYVRKKKKEENV